MLITDDDGEETEETKLTVKGKNGEYVLASSVFEEGEKSVFARERKTKILKNKRSRRSDGVTNPPQAKFVSQEEFDLFLAKAWKYTRPATNPKNRSAQPAVVFAGSNKYGHGLVRKEWKMSNGTSKGYIWCNRCNQGVSKTQHRGSKLHQRKISEFNKNQKDKFAKVNKELNLNVQHLNKAVQKTREKLFVNKEYGKHKLFCLLFL